MIKVGPITFLLALISTVTLSWSLGEIHEQDFCSLLDKRVYRNDESSTIRYFYIRAIFVVLWFRHEYTRAHGVQVTTESVYPITALY
jgi:hypothetical protein